MLVKSDIRQYIITPFLVFALLFPSAFQFSHLFEGHDHKPCNDVLTHIHEDKLDCSINFFFFSKIYLFHEGTQEILVTKVEKKASEYFIKRLHNNTYRFKQLRAPPAYI
ncbi:MAG: hypothetical protein CL605_08010 [Altibacter sp.]|nr:hypothetical protein [Altibacter sp.]